MSHPGVIFLPELDDPDPDTTEIDTEEDIG